jgi:hypothetical protein
MAALTTLALAAAGVASAGASLVSGIRQANVSRYNAELARQNQQIATQQASADEAAFRQRAERIKSAQRAAIGAAGITLEGSPLDVISDTEVQLEKQALDIRYRGTLGARRYGIEAANDDYRAGAAETSGYIGAATQLLTYAGPVARRWDTGQNNANSGFWNSLRNQG